MVSIVSRTEYICTHRFLFPAPVSIVTLKQARTSVACREEQEEGAQPSESAEFMRGEWEKTSKWVEDEKKDCASRYMHFLIPDRRVWVSVRVQSYMLRVS